MTTAILAGLSRESSLDAIAGLEACVRVFLPDDDDRQEQLLALQGGLIEELGLGPNGMDLDDDPEYVALMKRADRLELQLRRKLR